MTIGTGKVPQNSSIHLRLTNYLEHRDVYDAYNFQLGDVVSGNSVAANTTVMTTSINGYFCPSDANPGSNQNLNIGYTVPVSCVNYAVNAGTNRSILRRRRQRNVLVAGRKPLLRQPDRLLGHPRRHQQHGGIQRVDQGKGRRQYARAEPGLPDRTAFLGGPQQDVTACQAASTPLWDFKGEYWTLQDTGRGGPYYHIMPPNQPSCNTSAALASSTRSSPPVHSTPAVSTSCSWTARSGSSRAASISRSGTRWAPGPAARSSARMRSDRQRRRGPGMKTVANG